MAITPSINYHQDIAPVVPPVVVAPMLTKDPPVVFPLHLAPIDLLYLQDDRPDCPMTSWIHLDFTGHFRRPVFEQALSDALRRHPLLRAVVKPVKQDKPCWVSSDGLQPAVDWDAYDAPIVCPDGEYLDIRNEVGIRVWIRQGTPAQWMDARGGAPKVKIEGGDGPSRLTIQVHHACTDGTGIYRFIGDLLAAYGMHTSGDRRTYETTELEPRTLRDRRRKMAGVAINGSQWQGVCNAARQAVRLFGRKICPVFSPQQPRQDRDADVRDFPNVQSFTFSAAEHRCLRDKSAELGVVLNDLLIAVMFQAICRWNRQRGHLGDRNWLRVVVPVDLRSTEDYAMPAANLTTYTYLTRRVKDCSQLKHLLGEVRADMAGIKNGNSANDFMDAVMFTQAMPTWTRRFIDMKRIHLSNKTRSTAILSNVGDPARRFTATLPREDGKIVSGNLRLEGVSGVPPLRPGTHATLALFTYRRQLTISVRCNPRLFSARESHQFLMTYVDGLRSQLGS